MQVFGFKSDDLLDFIDELRRHGYRITPEQCISAQNLVLALAAFGNPNYVAARLSKYLGPVLCTSPDEQEDFEKHFHEWQYSGTTPSTIANERMRSDTLLKRVYAELWSLVRNRSPMLFFISANVIIIIGFGLLWYKQNELPVFQSPITLDEPSQFLVRTLLAVAAAIVSAIVTAWFAWVLLRRSTLRKKLTSEDVKTEELFVKGAGEQFARLLAVRHIAQELKRPEALSSADLDVEATINQTIMKGIFTLVDKPRRASPEYLVLIDRTGFNDQRAGLEDEIVKRLVKSGVYINRFYFQDDPRFCRRDDGKDSYVSLRELAALYGNRRLIIFGDGAAFFNQVSGRLERWTSIFFNWQRRVLLTPHNIEIDYRRGALLDQGFVLIPAERESLSALANVFNETPASSKGSKTLGPFPKTLLDRPERWIDSHSPSNDIVDEVCEELNRFLGPEGYSWLGACAVYPMLYWKLTLYLGYKLSVEYKTGSVYWVEQTFKSLMQLPWFRQGSIPDWFRTRLISDLSFDQRRHIKKVLEELLTSSLYHPTELALPIVVQRPEGNRGHSVLKKARGIVNRIALRLRLWDVIKTASPERPLRDHVFLSFVTRFTFNDLVISVPPKVQKALLSRHKFIQGKKRQGKTIRERISKLRTASATHSRLVPFFYFSLGAWILVLPQYAILLATPFIYFNSVSIKTFLSLGILENAFWASAILSLHPKQSSRNSVAPALLVTFAVIIGLVTYQTTTSFATPFTQIEAVLTAAIFAVLALWIMQLGLSKISAAIFFIHGFSQWVWRLLWLSSAETTQVIKLAFPVWRIVLLIAWIKLMSDISQRAVPSNKDSLSALGLSTIKVMISSTTEDLGPERKAAERAIRSLNLTSLRIETFGSTPYSSKSMSSLQAEQCDIFVLIIGERYGHVIKSEEISSVEFEYEAARAQNPAKIFVYAKEGVNREPRLDEFLNRLQDFQSGYFASRFTSVEDLQKKLQLDIARWLVAAKGETR